MTCSEGFNEKLCAGCDRWVVFCRTHVKDFDARELVECDMPRYTTEGERIWPATHPSHLVVYEKKPQIQPPLPDTDAEMPATSSHV